MKNYIKLISLLLTVMLLLGSMTAVFTVNALADEVTEGDGSDTNGGGEGSEDGSETPGTEQPEGPDAKSDSYKNAIYATPEEKLATMTLKRERGDYQLYVDTYSGEVALKNTVTNEILFSNPYDIGSSKADDSENSTKEELLSQIIVKFTNITDNTTNTFLSFREAAYRNQIRVKNIKNGIRVEYTMGREQAKMLVPKLIEKSRFDALVEAMEKNIAPDDRISQHQMTKLKSYYVLKDTSTMEPDEAEDVQTKYPATKTMAVYVFDPTVNENEVARCENIIKTFAPDYTYEDLDEDHELTQYVSDDANPPLFKMALEYTLDENGVNVRLPANGIRFNESLFRLESITVLPYMGAGNNAYEGYNFFPDGSGALFDYQDLNTNTAKTVSGKVYGKDFAYHAVTGEYQKTISYPVFGAVEETVFYKYTDFNEKVGDYEVVISAAIVDKYLDENYANESLKKKLGDIVAECGLKYSEILKSPTAKVEVIEDKRGFMAIIEEGDALSELSTTHHGSKSEYNALQIKVTPRPTDSYKVSDSLSVNAENNEWTVVCDKKYVGSYRIKYVLLSDYKAPEGKTYKTYDTSWFGMAVAYRDYLMSGETPILTPLSKDELTKDIPLYIETFGALETLEKVLSVPVKTMTPLTTFEDIKTMYEDISEGEDGIKNVNFKLTGYANGGLESKVPYRFKIEKAVGGKKGFQDLLNYAADVNKTENANLGIFPDFDFAYVKYTGGFDGLNLNKHIVKTIDDRYASRRTYTATQGMVNYYEMAISPAYFQRFYEKITKTYAEKFSNIVGISAASLGSALNSDFDEDEPYNREDSKNYTIGAFKYLDQTYNQVMTAGGNAYSWQYVDHILGVALDSSRYNISASSVPFIGVVLHGSVQFAGAPLNMEGNMDYAMLKAIENGASPYFILSYRNTQNLKENEYFSKYYSVRYDIWKEDIVETYNELNSALSDVQDKFIIGHEIIETGLRVPDLDEIQNDILDAMDKFQDAQENAAEIEKQEILNSVSSAREACRQLLLWADMEYENVWNLYSVTAKADEEQVVSQLALYKNYCAVLAQYIEKGYDKAAEGTPEYKTYSDQYNLVKNTRGILIKAIAKLAQDLMQIEKSIDTLNEKIDAAYESVEIIRNKEILDNPELPLTNQAISQIESAKANLEAQKFTFKKTETREPSKGSDVIMYYAYDEDGNKVGRPTTLYYITNIDGEKVAFIGDNLTNYKFFTIVSAPDDPDAFNVEGLGKVIVTPYVEEDLGNGVFKNRKANGQYYYYSKNSDGSIKDYYFFDGTDYTAIKYKEEGTLDGITIYALVDTAGEYILDSNGDRMYRSGSDVDNRAEYILMQSMNDSRETLEAIVNGYLDEMIYEGNIPEDLKITKQDVLDRVVIDDDEEGDKDDDEKEESRYSTGNIIAVTYGTLEGEAYKTMLLNYNNYMVTLVFDGVRYTIPAYGFVVIKN